MANRIKNLFRRKESEPSEESTNSNAENNQTESISEPSEQSGTGSQLVKSKANRTRNKTMNLRFSQEEIDEMNGKILQSGKRKTDFILSCIRNKLIIVIPDLSEAMTEIRKQGVNLNQMAKALNEYAVGLKSFGIRMNNENATWRAITMEIEALREENLKTQEMLESIQKKLEETVGEA